MSKIKSIDAPEIMVSRGSPTTQVSVTLDSGAWPRCLPGPLLESTRPSNSAMGARGCYNGKDVLKAVHNVIDIIPPTVRELDAADQKSLDEKPIKARETWHTRSYVNRRTSERSHDARSYL